MAGEKYAIPIGGTYSITINPVANGFIVTAGCLTLVFEGKGFIKDELARWIEDPEAVQEEYRKRHFPAPDLDLLCLQPVDAPLMGLTATQVARGVARRTTPHDSTCGGR